MIARFINQDPIGLAGGMNLYRLEGTVQNARDPLGLFVWFLAPFAPELVALAQAALVTAGVLTAAVVAEEITNSIDSANEDVSIKDKTKIGKCEDNKSCPPCNPPAGVPFNKVTHDHGNCLGRTGSIVHWHYDVNN